MEVIITVKRTTYATKKVNVTESDIERLENGDGALIYEDGDLMTELDEIEFNAEYDYEVSDAETGEVIVPFM